MHHCIPQCETSHPDNPIPKEPTEPRPRKLSITDSHGSPRSSATSFVQTSSSEPESPITPSSEVHENPLIEEDNDTTLKSHPWTQGPPRKRRASTVLVSHGANDVQRILSGLGSTRLAEKVCCGGGCCFLNKIPDTSNGEPLKPVSLPNNDAFQSLKLDVGLLSLDTVLTNVVDLPDCTVSFEAIPSSISSSPPIHSTVQTRPPAFVTPHPPYEVFSAKLHHARELTKQGAEKRTYHFDLDVTSYPAESGNVDFVVGGAIGVCAPNSEEVVNAIFDALGVTNFARDKPIILHTTGGRWPTIWGDEMARELITTRRELLTWCSDVQSYPPTKPLLRVMAEYADAPNEKKILTFLSSAQGQATFCDLRTGPHISLAQLLHAFPSSKPPLPQLLSVLNQLMPRFYSLSQDPSTSSDPLSPDYRRVIEMAVTVHESPNWRGGPRTGTGSGFLERTARKLIAAERSGVDPKTLDLRVPMFRGLMANPLAREFVTDGPMLLIGAGVGIAPFRGFVQNRLKSANCANKVWVLQGVRDSLLDELYQGEWGVEEEKVKKVVQSRRGESRYVQEEVRHQADLVWFVINALDGRVFVCGSSKGMGEGVEAALVDVAMDKGNLNWDEAKAFWDGKKEGGQFIAETW